MNRHSRRATLVAVVCAFAFALSLQAAELPAAALMQPDALAKTLQSGAAAKPLMLQVGSHKLFQQAHIAGSEYVGAGSEPEGLQKLKARVAKLPKNTAIVLYCGCCPWEHCPNVQPAYEALRSMGFTHVKVLYIAHNFGADWVDKGYPVAKGD